MSIVAPETCLVCHTPCVLTYLESHTDPLGGETYDLFSCPECGVWFWNPLKNPGNIWYERDERYAGRNEDPILDPNINHTQIISYLGQHTGRVLDVGCGVGNFLAWAQKHGWEPYGIDFDSDAIAAAKRTFGITNLEVLDLKEFKDKYPDLKFDLITAFDVFEHIDNHVEFLELIRSMLTENGHIAMSMPYRKRALWLLSGDVPPRHLTRWDRTSLSNFLEKRGYAVRRINRRTDGIRHLILKMRFRYGKHFSVGLVRAVKNSVQEKSGRAPSGIRKFKIRMAENLAKVKDAVLFGLPALAIYLWMLPGTERYLSLYVIAQKTNST